LSGVRGTIQSESTMKVPSPESPKHDAGDRVTLLGIAGNVLLLGLKLLFGLVSGSVALVADGVHSGSDMATDLAVLGGMHLGRRSADADHPYGHGRFETLAGGAVAGILIVVGALIAWEAVAALQRGVINFPGIPVLTVSTASILVKEWLYRRTIRVARNLGSPALQANAWHHRSDALSSIAVLAGGVGGLAGWGHADHLAGLIVGLMVIVAGVRTLAGVLHELTEGGLSPEELARIERAVAAVDGLREWHHLRTRRVGRETFIDLHALVEPTLSVIDAHRIANDVEASVQESYRRPANITVHIEPDVEAQRKR
jgi:cation diffusion facilitator family transporter